MAAPADFLRTSRPSAPIRRFATGLARRVALVAGCLALAAGGLGAGAATAEPAVKQASARVVAAYDWVHVFSEEAYRVDPPPATLSDAQEIDIDAGGFTGFYTFPIDEQFGARAFAGPTFSKVHPDTRDELSSYGLLLGGDAFWRDPTLGELGLGTFYLFEDAEVASPDGQFRALERNEHTAGVRAFGSIFLTGVFLLGDADVDASMRFSDSDIDSDGNASAQRNYSAQGGLRIYPTNHFSMRVGGRWSRTNFGTGEHVEQQVMDVDFDVLLPMAPNITLNGGFTVGTREEQIENFQRFGRMVLGFGVSATVSFTDAVSLLELNRHYY